MYTRCPRCKTVHPLDAASLSHAHGLVQCGQCGRSFSALSFLFDEWPAGQAYHPRKGTDKAAPVLGRPTPQPENGADDSNDAETVAPETGGKRWAWGLAATALIMLTLANVAWTFREPLAETPLVGDWLQDTGWLQPGTEELLHDPAQLHLVSRDMHAHPTRSGVLVLSITFVNLARYSQPYPVLEITLLDGINRPVARRNLQPADYLRPGAAIDAGLAPDVYLPVLLEFADPGMQAVGFEIHFL